jgi:hypothetical protein
MSENQTQPDNADAPTPADDAEQAEEPDIHAAADEIADSGSSGMDMMGFLEDGGVKNLLMQDTYKNTETGHEYSQADLLADIVNVMRMDTKQVLALHDIDVEVEKMGPERAAELVENLATSDDAGLDIVKVFEEIEEQRSLLLKELFEDGQYEQYEQFKAEMMFSVDYQRNPDAGGDA